MQLEHSERPRAGRRTGTRRTEDPSSFPPAGERRICPSRLVVLGLATLPEATVSRQWPVRRRPKADTVPACCAVVAPYESGASSGSRSCAPIADLACPR
jgi:hypothetical protein